MSTTMKRTPASAIKARLTRMGLPMEGAPIVVPAEALTKLMDEYRPLAPSSLVRGGDVDDDDQMRFDLAWPDRFEQE